MPKAKVSSRPERFRRAGMEFTREARVVEVDEKTLKVLQDEPMLAVEVLQEKEDKKKEGKEDKKEKGA
ncbi:MAG: HI1506-related protein [Thermodesulfobacteriota bacterium]|nr:MAG: HI1506-related protein [Thermodesulfobacteriota bacterium]